MSNCSYLSYIHVVSENPKIARLCIVNTRLKTHLFLLLCFLFQSIREVQTSLRDGVILFRALLDEVRRNMEAERDGIMTTYAKLIDTLKKQYEVLIKDLER